MTYDPELFELIAEYGSIVDGEFRIYANATHLMVTLNEMEEYGAHPPPTIVAIVSSYVATGQECKKWLALGNLWRDRFGFSVRESLFYADGIVYQYEEEEDYYA